MLEIKISEKPKKKKTIFIQKHYSECVWKDKEGNISFIECPYCTLLGNSLKSSTVYILIELFKIVVASIFFFYFRCHFKALYIPFMFYEKIII